MNSKILIAFTSGALIASGIVYVAVRPEEARYPAGVAVVQPKLPAPAPVAQADPPPVIAPPIEVQPPTVPAAEPAALPAPAPVPPPSGLPGPPSRHEKPSPLRSPARHERPVIFARATPPQEPAPSPMPAPINKERPYNDAKPADAPPAPPPIPDSPPVQEAPPPVVTAPPDAPVPQQEAPVPPPPQVPETRMPNRVTIQPGTVLAVRIGETISSASNVIGDGFLATLERPLVVDGFIIAERGARVEGRVVEAVHPGRASGQTHLGIELTELSTSDGQRIRVRTALVRKEAGSSTGGDLAKIGAGAAIGAAIGAAAGGGKGAGIGAGIGGAAGTADVLLTHGKPAQIPVETRISFRIQDPITITERLQ